MGGEEGVGSVGGGVEEAGHDVVGETVEEGEDVD